VPCAGGGTGVVRVAVIGAGIAGLAVAQRLRDAHDVVVFEREPVAGGKIRSEHIEQFLFEWGPGGFLSSAAEVRELAAGAGLGDALLEAAPAAKNRFIYWNGALHKLPAKPPEIVSFSLLSARAKLRALADLAIARRAASVDDESVSAFIARRFGREVAERVVAPAVLGISGGDAAATSIAALLPRVVEFEREHGSVIRGMIRGGRAAARLTTFAGGGMQRLTDRLAEQLGTRLHRGAGAERIEPQAGGWHVIAGGQTSAVDAVIVATPSGAAADLVAGFDATLAQQLRAIAYAPMRAIGVAFRAADVPASLEGFGFLAARGSGVRILGATYTSTIVPEQAPPGTAYVRVFVGGAVDPDAAGLDASTVRAFVLNDLRTVLGITAEPIAYHEVIWPQAIPQYTLGHRARVTAIDAQAAHYPGLALAGNAYRGLGVGDTVRDAFAVAATLLPR
jgi:oxygen-dependent protoporphyrinogen oxidase